MIDARRFASATSRNRDAILEVLRAVLPARGAVLEVASGSGEHAVYFAKNLPGLRWQPSDPDPAARASIAAWIEATGVQAVGAPMHLDAAADAWPVTAADAVVCINMIHIAPWQAAEGLLRGAARVLPPGGPLVLYGPFQRDGRHTAPSNAAFDASLRAQNPAWGVRDLGEVTRAATAVGLLADRIEQMPANNLTVVFRASGHTCALQ